MGFFSRRGKYTAYNETQPRGIPVNPFQTEDSALDEEIARVYTHMKAFSAEDSEYQKAADQLAGLYKLKHDQAKLNLELYQTELKNHLEQDQVDHERELESRPWYQRVSPDTAVVVTGNAVIALIVIKYEQHAVISSKLFSFLKKI